MKRLRATILITLVAVASPAWAQGAHAPRKPRPEFRTEGEYFVGTWSLTGETKPSPFSLGGQRFESSERLEWMPGAYFLMARSYEGDKWTGVTIIGYDDNRKVFTHTSYTPTGTVETMQGIVQGATETWSGERHVDGKSIRQRLTINKLSSNRYSFRLEMAPENGNWSVVYEGQAVKTSSLSRAPS